ncbi:hypothetical protein [Streptomyces albireticuli]|nr:hypothetical protein [Streptomyces albireticuli]
MSARTRCRVCGWSRTYRNQYAGRRAARTHTCLPILTKGLAR